MKAELDVAWQRVADITAAAQILHDEAANLQKKANAMDNKASKLWDESVNRICGESADVQWTDTGCVVLGVMEFIGPTPNPF